MEKRLVDAQKYFEVLRDDLELSAKYFRIAVDHLNEMPTVDAVEVVHGRWEPELMPTGVECAGHAEMTVQALSCSVCGKCVDVSEGYFSYCPNCGAKMDGERKDND